jgi:hypothetical protein
MSFGTHFVWATTSLTTVPLSGAPGIGVTLTIATVGDGVGEDTDDGVAAADAVATGLAGDGAVVVLAAGTPGVEQPPMAMTTAIAATRGWPVTCARA